ncbi:MAG: PKD domain-containing protein [Thermoanaerobaculia bacterium]
MRTLPTAPIILTLLAAPALAATIVVPSDARLVEKSEIVVVGRVTSVEQVEIDGAIRTEARITVERTLKGAPAPTVTVREIGGRLGDRITVLFGTPEYIEGERVLAFLAHAEDGSFRTVDLLVGKFSEERRGEAVVWTRDLEESGARLLGEAAADVAAARDAAAFEEWIRDRAAGLDPPATYFLDRGDRTSVTSDFSLIAEPEIYRWFAFEDGGTVAWRSAGTQSGYAGGGVGELQTGMSVWTSYASAHIQYAYTGPTTTTGGLDAPNGMNEVVFSDPNGEIAGSWNGTDGVLATGGFNAVSGPRAWTAPFAGGPGHQAGPRQAYAILEGSIVVQDGVSSSSGISSGMLAEVMAHEFGHTLGFGHSSDPTALMYASLQNIGAFLRNDDQTAARWLYPSSGAAPPEPPVVPAAPSNLAVVELGPDSAQINWKDNATDETAQILYVRPAGGAFAKFTEVGANVTTANLSLEGGRTYSIRVTARNAAGESAPSNTIDVQVPLPPLEAAFSLAPPTGTAGITTFSFYDQSTGRIASRQWSFGDGGGSTLTNPTHLYQQPGSFQVRLTIRGIDGKEAVAERAVLVAAPPLFVADFAWEPGQVLAGTPVRFEDQSAGSPISWSWTFGDGTSSTEQNPTKTFDAPGIYRVGLSIGNGVQTSLATRDVTVLAGAGGEPPVTAEFDATTFQPRAGQTVHFTDRSTGSPSAWSWDFGDGAKSTLQSPSHSWTSPGTYLVTLVAARGGISSTRTRVVHVREASAAYHGIVPAAAQTPGAAGSEWRTDLALHNAGSEAADVTVRYIPDPGVAAATRTIRIPAKSTLSWTYALQSIFGLASGRGALAIDATASSETPELHVSSRTYTASGDATYGQFVPAVDPPTNATTLWLTGIESTAAFRTNIGWTNPSERTVRARLRMWDASGADLGSRDLDLAPSSFGQLPLATIYDFLATQPRSGLTLRITTDGEGIVAYASLVDQRTNDPTFLLARELPSGDRLVVPAVAKTPGAGGTFWRTDLALFNPASTLMQVRVRLLESGLDNRFAPWKEIAISPSRGVTIADLYGWLGRGSGTGALEIAWSGAANGPVVTSRTYTTRASDGGTFGQAVPAIALDDPETSLVIAGLRSDARFRANVGFVSHADVPTGVSIQAIAPDGTPLAESFVPLAPRTHLQMPLASLFPSLPNADTIGEVTLVARPSGDPSILLYGSVVDRASGDPVFID